VAGQLNDVDLVAPAVAYTSRAGGRACACVTGQVSRPTAATADSVRVSSPTAQPSPLTQHRMVWSQNSRCKHLQRGLSRTYDAVS
jgi:hypothetical protein